MTGPARPFAELVKLMELGFFELSRERRWELCAQCPLQPCEPKSPACRCRRFINERQIEYRKRNPKSRKPLTPAQREHRTAANRRYYAECADVIKEKERARYWANRDRILARKRARQSGVAA